MAAAVPTPFIIGVEIDENLIVDYFRANRAESRKFHPVRFQVNPLAFFESFYRFV